MYNSCYKINKNNFYIIIHPNILENEFVQSVYNNLN